MDKESIISIRVDKDTRTRMKLHDEINWSSILRRAIAKEIEHLERIDSQRAKKAAKMIDTIRKSKAFDSGKSSVEIIREWRDKRK
jgi:hypothetical protein